jgi:hypothetical protein
MDDLHPEKMARRAGLMERPPREQRDPRAGGQKNGRTFGLSAAAIGRFCRSMRPIFELE